MGAQGAEPLKEERGVAAAGAERGRLVGAILVAVVGLGVAAPLARADGPDAALRAARQLFADAEKDEDAYRWRDALEKLRRVAAVKRTSGVRYHIALCEEHLGRLAAALDEYTAASEEAQSEDAQDVLRLVGPRIADLSPRVPRLTLRVTPDAPGAVVTVDGARVPQAMLGAALPLDPGDHRVDAKATDRAPFSRMVTLHERDATTLEVKLLPAAPPAPAPPAGSPDAAAAGGNEPSAGSSGSAGPPSGASPPSAADSRTPAILATAGAVVLTGAGIGAYALAGHAHDAGRASCAQIVSVASNACSSRKQTVRAWDYTAAGAWVAAAAAASIAVVLWVRSPSEAPAAAMIVGPGSVAVEGRF